MKFSTKTRYGIRTLLEIALHTEGMGVFQKDIAENQKLSIKYLDHIISALKVAGLICNLKGKKSGYILTRSPQDISMLDVYNSFEPGVCVVDCLATSVDCELENSCATKEFWQGMNDVIEVYLTGVSLADIVRKHEAMNATKQ